MLNIFYEISIDDFDIAWTIYRQIKNRFSIVWSNERSKRLRHHYHHVSKKEKHFSFLFTLFELIMKIQNQQHFYESFFSFLHILKRFKNIFRANWIKHDVSSSKNVSDHSFRMIVLCLMLKICHQKFVQRNFEWSNINDRCWQKKMYTYNDFSRYEKSDYWKHYFFWRNFKK